MSADLGLLSLQFMLIKFSVLIFSYYRTLGHNKGREEEGKKTINKTKILDYYVLLFLIYYLFDVLPIISQLDSLLIIYHQE